MWRHFMFFRAAPPFTNSSLWLVPLARRRAYPHQRDSALTAAAWSAIQTSSFFHRSAMSQPRDIRSFFGAANAPATKKRRTTATRSVVTATETDEENAGAAQLKVAAPSGDEKNGDAPAAASKELVVDPAVEEVVAAEEEEVGPLEHKLKNLQHNAKHLMDASWYKQLETEFTRPYFKSLVTFLASEEAKKKTIYPSPENVFATLRDCPFDSLKVVILGQDPYHGPHQAHGLSFSVLPGVATPPSLMNIYKEAISDVKIKKPSHGCLTGWSKQGVLMLNTVLTVRRGEPNSHKNQGWEKLTDVIIGKINHRAQNVVFLLWGRPAQLKGALIDKNKHLVITSSHPSPLGATKTNEPFIGSKCFSKANKYLEKHGKDAINWNDLDL